MFGWRFRLGQPNQSLLTRRNPSLRTTPLKFNTVSDDSDLQQARQPLGVGVWLVLAVWVVLALTCYQAVLNTLVNHWKTNPSFSHGPLVAPIALGLLWIRRRSRPAPSAGWLPGLAILVVAHAVHALAQWLHLPSISLWTIPIWVIGWVGWIGGSALLRWSLPAIGMLCFMIPPPFQVEQFTDRWLQFGSAEVACWLSAIVRVPAVTDGFTLWVPSGRLAITEDCSGFGMSVALLAFLYLFVFCQSKRRGSKAFWGTYVRLAAGVSGAIIAAIAANASRIACMAVSMHWYGDPDFTSHVHDIGDWFMLPVSLPLMILIFHWMRQTRHARQLIRQWVQFPEYRPGWESLRSPLYRSLVPPFVAGIVIASLVTLRATTVSGLVEQGSRVAQSQEASGDWTEASETYRQLIHFHSDPDFVRLREITARSHFAQSREETHALLLSMEDILRRKPFDVDCLRLHLDLALRLNDALRVTQTATKLMQVDAFEPKSRRLCLEAMLRFPKPLSAIRWTSKAGFQEHLHQAGDIDQWYPRLVVAACFYACDHPNEMNPQSVSDLGEALSKAIQTEKDSKAFYTDWRYGSQFRSKRNLDSLQRAFHAIDAETPDETTCLVYLALAEQSMQDTREDESREDESREDESHEDESHEDESHEDESHEDEQRGDEPRGDAANAETKRWLDLARGIGSNSISIQKRLGSLYASIQAWNESSACYLRAWRLSGNSEMTLENRVQLGVSLCESLVANEQANAALSLTQQLHAGMERSLTQPTQKTRFRLALAESRLAMALDSYEQAIQSLQVAELLANLLAEDQPSTTDQQRKVEDFQAQCLVRLQRYPQAARLFEARAARPETQSNDQWIAAARAWRQAGELSQAIRCYGNAFQRSKTIDEAWLEYLYLVYQTRGNRFAIEAVRQAKPHAPHHILAQAWEIVGEEDQAIRHYRESASDNVQDVPAYVIALARAGSLETALSTIEGESWPTDDVQRAHTAAMCGVVTPVLNERQTMSIQAIIDSVLARRSGDAELHVAVAQWYVRRELPGTAVKHLERALSIDPEHPVAGNNLAMLLADRGEDYDRALQSIDRVMKRFGASPEFLDTRGWILLRMDRVEDSVRWLTLSIQQSISVDPVTQLHLAAAYLAIGNEEEARKSFQVARELDIDSFPLHPSEKQALKRLIEHFANVGETHLVKEKTS